LKINTTILRSNFVENLAEDAFHRIWVAGELGIELLSTENLQLLPVESLQSEEMAELMKAPVSFLMTTRTGNLWLCSRGHIYKVMFNSTGTVKKVIRISDTPIHERGCVLSEIDGYVWFFHKGKMCRISESVASSQEPQPVSVSLDISPLEAVFSIFHCQNNVWIGTSNGLYCYDLTTDTSLHYVHDAQNPSSLSQNYVTSITSTRDNQVIVGTLLGLNVFNASTSDFTRIQAGEVMEMHGLSCNFINTLYADDENDIIWVGTEIGGISKMFPSRLSVINYYHQQNLPSSLSRNPVNAIVEDEYQTLWVGTVEGGLNCRLKGSDTFLHYTTEAPAYLAHNTVSVLVIDDKDRLYVGTWGGGLGWINRKPSASKRYVPLPLSDPFVSSLAFDPVSHLLWIGTMNNVYVYNPADGIVSEPFLNEGKEVVNQNALGMCITRERELWISSPFGLLRINLTAYDKGQLKYQKYVYQLDNPASKRRERITSIFQAKDGTIWLGSNGNGFYKAMKKGNDYQFLAFTKNDGLVSNSVRGMLEDWYGNIWISTDNGLSCFNVKEESFRNYSQIDGLVSDQFYWNAGALSFDKERLFFGSQKGLTEIHPMIETEHQRKFPLAFTHCKVFGQEVFPQSGEIVMHESDKSLSIEFSALDYALESQAQYSYRLKGFDDAWVTVPSNRNNATYTNLYPGKYVFQLRYAPDGKHWLARTEELTIVVNPYFYKTPWFLLSVLFVILFGGYRILRWRYQALKRQQNLLHQMVEERTSELEEQKKLLSNQTQELSEQNKLLKDQNEKITAQKNQILEMSRKVEELTVDKLAFFTNITHEFRTPLTLIVGPIERALKLSYNPQVIEQLHLVERNSKYLLSLVNQLMDFRKVEEGRIKIATNYGNLKEFMLEIVPPFADYAKNRGINLQLYLRLPDPFLMFDEDVMRKIMTNLISNALKFTPKGGNVGIYVGVIGQATEKKLFISVRDTGKGIPENDIERIFMQFYQSDNRSLESVSGQSGTGIGLYLCRKLIDLLDGKIYAKNNPLKGASFRILLPALYGDTQIHSESEMEKEDIAIDVPRNGKMVILVVEDNKDMRDYIRSILAEYYNVLEASQGEEALALLHANNVDFIISDLMMPVMDGMELSRRVKNDFSISHIPFLMLTAKTSDEARLESYKMGADAFLLKPFDENMLLARISNILENRKRFQQKFSIDMNTDSLEVEENSGDKKFLNKAMSVVKENYKNPDFEVSDFIEAVGISKSLLNKKMQSLTGQSAGQFIRNYRLNLARELLLKNKVNRTMNISEIAYEVGFNDPKYFTRCFTKHFNVTPSSLLED
jgi:signal transduction histidine kinase/ligand-binding sensor domain-containing protein/DNA-binding NarL/FixJ family response regulator